jgi:D-glycero-D-manno-heptose 1,7-bisphosphate phosphatase
MLSKAKKAAFLDRDGVVNKKAAEHHYIHSLRDFVFTEGVFDICVELAGRGFEFIILTNQRGIARGLYTDEDVYEIHEHIKEHFRKHSLPLLAIYYCPHEEGECECRKPRDGMLRFAVRDFDVDLQELLMISDSQDDIAMAERFGVGRRILIPSDDILSAKEKLYM